VAVPTFASLSLDAALMSAVKELGFARPTPIQLDSIPPARDGRDVLACAQTGSGKTAAFLLPILHRMLAGKQGATRALIVVPTRELALQVLETAQALTVHTPLTSAAIYGGVGMGPQEHAFRTKADLMVATPGRLLDHMTKPYASLAGVQHLVLDEADRMLDMGFMPDVERILSRTPRTRQTAMFSATVPTVVRIISKRHMRDAVTVQVKPEERTVSSIEQIFYEVAERDKPAALRAVLRERAPERAMIFCRTQIAVDRLMRILQRDGLQVEAIHGSMGQGQRERVIADFRSGKVTLLVATNLAARGLDIPEVSHVINYDIPEESESYVHRIGRTARMGREGMAITFVAEWDEKSLAEIKKVTNNALREERLSLYA